MPRKKGKRKVIDLRSPEEILADEFLADAAVLEGLTPHAAAKLYGYLDKSSEKRNKRREVPVSQLGEGQVSGLNNRTAWGEDSTQVNGSIIRAGLIDKSTSPIWNSDYKRPVKPAKSPQRRRVSE